MTKPRATYHYSLLITCQYPLFAGPMRIIKPASRNLRVALSVAESDFLIIFAISGIVSVGTFYNKAGTKARHRS